MKKLILFGTMIFTCAVLFAQTETQAQNPESEEIELPEVTTVIKGESIKAGLDALPDFTDVIEPQDGSSELVPVLPDVEITEDTAPVNQVTQKEKDIYAEGQAGGGYPSLFMGDFSVYRQSGVNPFKLSFHHDSAAGYAGTALSEGYNNRNTSMSLMRTLNKVHFKFDYGAEYETTGLGLQNKVDNISAINNDFINANAKAQWELPKNFNIGVGSEGLFYTRYADIVSKLPIDSPNWLNVLTWDVAPLFFAGWSNGRFDINFNAQCWIDGLSCEEKTGARGDLGLDLGWSNEKVSLYGNVDGVFGNTVDGEDIVVPFTVGLNLRLPIRVSSSPLIMNLEGGLLSYQNKLNELEKKYKFTGFNLIPAETSEWYGKFDLSIPIKTEYTISADAEYYQTAYENGRYMPVYTGPVTCGLYSFENQNIQIFATKLAFTYHYKLFSVTGIWHSNWMDVPSLETAQAIDISLALQSQESKWGVNLSGSFGFGEGAFVPVVNLEGFIRATSAVRVVLAVEDIVTMCSGEPRVYSGQYAAQGGSASLLVKFFF